MSVCGYIGTYLAVYGPQIIGGFGLKEKSPKRKPFAVWEEQTTAVCGTYDPL